MDWHLREKGNLEARRSARRRGIPNARTHLWPVPLGTSDGQNALLSLKDFGELARSLLLDRYAPPSVLIDANYRCLSLFGPVDRYLSPAISDLLASVHAEWRPRLRAALRRAGGMIGADSGADDSFAADETEISIVVLPIRKAGEELFLVSFLDRGLFRDTRGASAKPIRQSSVGPVSFRFGPVKREAVEIDELSPRQRAVLDFLVMGYSNKQIAAALGISRRTVESHRAIVMRKLDVRTFAGLIQLAATA